MLREKYHKEVAVAKSVNDKMHYFDDLAHQAQWLTQESIGMLDVAKTYIKRLGEA